MTDQQRTPDETQPHPASDAGPAAEPTATGGPDPAEPSRADGSGDRISGPRLSADPARPSDTAWREPAWFPPRDRDRAARSNPIAIIIGLAMIAVGVYFFVDRTLGIALPRIQWSAVWPVILIVIGGLVLLRSVNRRT